jgi:hypothetical protein
MSYNYDITNKYSLNENNDNLYILELILKDNLNNIKTFRQITKKYKGVLISNSDNILYNDIKKYKLTFFSISNMNNPIIIKRNINHLININSYMINNIYIEIRETNNKLMEITYQIKH